MANTVWRSVVVALLAVALTVTGETTNVVPPQAKAAPPGITEADPAAAAAAAPVPVPDGEEPRKRKAGLPAELLADPAFTADAPSLGELADSSDDLPDSELDVALAEAARTGRPVELASETTETTISYAQPDGTVQVESAAGPVRTKVAGEWVAVDTALRATGGGVQPAAVTGEITFSGGGTAPMAVLGDGEGTSLSLSWPADLPKPELVGDTATYRNVFPGVDLVLTATRLGFQQQLVVNSRPDAATLGKLSRLEFPMSATGADVKKGDGGQLQVLDKAGKVVGTAAAPLMWDARTDPHTGDPVALEKIGLEVAQPRRQGSDATLVLTPARSFLTDPGTVYPVTIDPTQALGALGDTFVQSNIANSPQGGSTELRSGTYDGVTVARGLLRFDVGPVKNRVVQSANLALFEFHSYSCDGRWVDIRDADDFDPGLVTWNSQPWIGGIVANAHVAAGHSSACPARWVDFNVTGHVDYFSDSRNGEGNVMALAVTAPVPENDKLTWKKFNSGNAAGNVPLLTFTYDGVCDQYAGYRVCGQIRDKYNAVGGTKSFLGMPTTHETPTPHVHGAYSHFQGGSIYWSPTTGAQIIHGAIRNRWAAMGWEN